MKALLLCFAASLPAIGCTASGQVHTSAHVSAPELVYIDSDVQVIADYNEPIFYTSNYYWRYDGGRWYRSSNHTRGWVRIDVVPVSIRRIERPTAYVRYRGNARAGASTGRPDAKAAHKEERKDAKEERKDAREDRKEDRKDAKEDRKDAKEDRKDAKEDRKDAKHDNKHGKK